MTKRDEMNAKKQRPIGTWTDRRKRQGKSCFLRNDITFGKGDNAVRAVKNASFDVYKGETFSLVGESGSGKTTIGRAVSVSIPVQPVRSATKRAYLRQDFPFSRPRGRYGTSKWYSRIPQSANERATVDYIVSEGLYNFHLFENEADRVQKVENIINEVGLLPEHLT